MQIFSIETGNFKLDRGTMFCVVPKKLWKRTNLADFNNCTALGMRLMLIEINDQLLLVDASMANYQLDMFFGFYNFFGDFSLDKFLEKHSFHRDEITEVFFTHLQFDYCEGSIQCHKNKTTDKPAFKNANFWSNLAHSDWTTKPNAREKASFLPINMLPITTIGQLNFWV